MGISVDEGPEEGATLYTTVPSDVGDGAAVEMAMSGKPENGTCGVGVFALVDDEEGLSTSEDGARGNDNPHPSTGEGQSNGRH
jgi:hypothetical protein